MPQETAIGKNIPPQIFLGQTEGPFWPGSKSVTPPLRQTPRHASGRFAQDSAPIRGYAESSCMEESKADFNGNNCAANLADV